VFFFWMKIFSVSAGRASLFTSFLSSLYLVFLHDPLAFFLPVWRFYLMTRPLSFFGVLEVCPPGPPLFWTVRACHFWRTTFPLPLRGNRSSHLRSSISLFLISFPFLPRCSLYFVPVFGSFLFRPFFRYGSGCPWFPPSLFFLPPHPYRRKLY